MYRRVDTRTRRSGDTSKSGSGKAVIIILFIFVILVLIGGGIGGYILYKRRKTSTGGEDTDGGDTGGGGTDTPSTDPRAYSDTHLSTASYVSTMNACISKQSCTNMPYQGGYMSTSQCGTNMSFVSTFKYMTPAYNSNVNYLTLYKVYTYNMGYCNSVNHTDSIYPSPDNVTDFFISSNIDIVPGGYKDSGVSFYAINFDTFSSNANMKASYDQNKICAIRILSRYCRASNTKDIVIHKISSVGETWNGNTSQPMSSANLVKYLTEASEFNNYVESSPNFRKACPSGILNDFNYYYSIVFMVPA